MKRLFSSLALALALSFSTASSALAEHFWELQMFTPTQAVTSNSFPIEYKVFSVEQNDDFTVDLFQNGAKLATQNTTKDYGDSGVFTVSVPGPGTYKYHVTASITGGGESKTTEDRTMTVTTTPQGTTTTVFVNNVPDGGAAGGAAGAGGAGAAGGAGGGAAAGAPAVAGAQAGTAEGQATTGTGTTTPGDVLGAEKKDEAKKDGTSGWERAAMIGLPLLALAAAYYFLLHREGKGPLADHLKSKQ